MPVVLCIHQGQGRQGLVPVRRLLLPHLCCPVPFPGLPGWIMGGNWVDNEEMKQCEIITDKFWDLFCLLIYKLDQYFCGEKKQVVKNIVYTC